MILLSSRSGVLSIVNVLKVTELYTLKMVKIVKLCYVNFTSVQKVRFCTSCFWIWALWLLDLQNVAEVALCWLPGLGPKKLAGASISCLLECSPLEPSHHTVRMCKQSLHRLTRRGTEVPGPKPPSQLPGDSQQQLTSHVKEPSWKRSSSPCIAATAQATCSSDKLPVPSPA